MSSEPDKPAEGGTPPPAPSESGSVDVAVSGPLQAAESGSREIDVAVSGGHHVAVAAPQTDAIPIPVGAIESQPVSSGKVAVPVAANADPPERRSKRLTDAAKDAIGGGVTKLGTGLGALGEGVTMLGEVSRKVPLVGSSVSMLGEGLTSVGESLTELPRVAKTRRGRLLVRSLVVGFLIVAVCITAIVALQVRGTDAPDFRPNANEILTALSAGRDSIEQVYEQASPRFHEMVRKERFVYEMIDLDKTLGRFREITAVNDTLVTTGPTGRVGRVSLTVAYEKGKCKASVSLHYDHGRWKLLGIGVELPDTLEITQAEREERIQACKDPMDSKGCDLFVAANAILEQLRDGRADQVWEAATKIFQKQEEKTKFVEIQKEHAEMLGDYRRIIAVTEAKVIGGSNATYDVLLEYARSQGVRAIFGFYRRSFTDAWRLRSLKVVLPMPRAEETARATQPDELPLSFGAPDEAPAGGSSAATGSSTDKRANGSSAPPAGKGSASAPPKRAPAPARGSTAPPTTPPATGSATAPAPATGSASPAGSAATPAAGSAAPPP